MATTPTFATAARRPLAASLLVMALCLAGAGSGAEPDLGQAPTFRLEDTGGGFVTLESLLAEGPVILDFWATWCAPCRKALPGLQQLHERLAERGLRIVAISTDEPRNRPKIGSTARALGLTFPVLIDDDKHVSGLYRVESIPTTILIDREGRIRSVHRGYRSGDHERLEQEALALLEPARSAHEGDAIEVSNLLLWQAGRDPRTEAQSSTGLFNQLDLDYSRGSLRAGLRHAAYRPSREDGFVPARYDEVTMRFAEWDEEDLRVRVGHGFATIGRGLLFRAFELRGVIRDAVFPPARYLDSRSLDGAIVGIRRGPFSALALSGEPVRYPDVPPGVVDLPRREGHVSGGRVALALGQAGAVGAGYLRAERQPPGSQPELDEYASLDVTLQAARLWRSLAARNLDLQFYGEYAGRSWDPFADGLGLAGDRPRALYTATQVSAGRWGASLETKDYRRFSLGWNDPPNLVPEMPQHLLNRMSHFLLADGETGRQISVAGALPRGWSLQVESARARNDINGLRRYRLDAVTLEGNPHAAVEWECFVARGRDEVEGISDHRTAGLTLGRALNHGFLLRLTAERQRAERTTFDEVAAFDNTFLSLGVERSGLGSLAAVVEISTDPDEMDDPLTFDVVESATRRWLGFAATAPLGANHEATVFAGRRRGGTACTSGTCYLVPDFAGVELRLVSRF